jgi:hypothetical protein
VVVVEEVEVGVVVGWMFSRESTEATSVPMAWAISEALMPWLLSWRIWASVESWTVSPEDDWEEDGEVDELLLEAAVEDAWWAGGAGSGVVG